MFMISAYLSILICTAGAFEIKRVDLNDAHLIETNLLNFALSSPDLIENGWNTVSINWDQASIISPDCQVIKKSSQALSESEIDLIIDERDKLSNIADIQGLQASFKISRFSTDGSMLEQKSRGIEINEPGLNSNAEPSISKSDEDDYSNSTPDSPMNLARVFFKGDLITFVYLNGQVQMKPVSCLDPSEQQLIEQLQLESKQAEEQSKSKPKTDYQARNNIFGRPKFDMQLNDHPLNMRKNWDNIFAPQIPNHEFIPRMGYVRQPYNPYLGERSGLDAISMFHPQHKSNDNSGRLSPPPSVSQRGFLRRVY